MSWLASLTLKDEVRQDLDMPWIVYCPLYLNLSESDQYNMILYRRVVHSIFGVLSTIFSKCVQ